MILDMDMLFRKFVLHFQGVCGDGVQKYHEDGKAQFCEYLGRFQLDKGYILVFLFNKERMVGVQEKRVGEKLLMEAVV
ncbi:MAG: hypothetical protein LUE24_02175 [Lachnospiraceae bacterium]|nr:hypothetical protein [Lachnospiraceae bacterium]